ncbi:MAG TPA: hypothetical protein VNW25_05410, partial [Candidatus Sulfotelmatobacter sp.]|nr:hypothetical protein [Candidatus Sulfotelmatobacter sp.]
QLIVANLAQIEPWFIITYAADIIGNVLKPQYPTTQSVRGGFGGRESTLTYAVTIPEGIAILVGYFVITAVLGLLLFERKEFT